MRGGLGALGALTRRQWAAGRRTIAHMKHQPLGRLKISAPQHALHTADPRHVVSFPPLSAASRPPSSFCVLYAIELCPCCSPRLLVQRPSTPQ
eukprot:252010-Chlamydomonas_euryale.AAC.1